MLLLVLLKTEHFLIVGAIILLDLAIFAWQSKYMHKKAIQYFLQTGRFWTMASGYLVFFLLALSMFIVWVPVVSNVSFQERKWEAVIDEDLPDRQFHERFKAVLSEDGTTLTLSGIMAKDMNQKLWPLLSEAKSLTTFVLNSHGGNLHEARDLAQFVRDRDLDTHVTKVCSASCLLVFAAGSQRTLGPGAQLGAHLYGLDFLKLQPHLRPEHEMSTDRRYLQSRNIDPDFLNKLFDFERGPLWFPSRGEIQRSGLLTDF
ncbi:MAG: hypothetical protein ACRBBQ_11010 [Cognatishimia sp.]